jgi:hypothetical protein
LKNGRFNLYITQTRGIGGIAQEFEVQNTREILKKYYFLDCHIPHPIENFKT